MLVLFSVNVAERVDYLVYFDVLDGIWDLNESVSEVFLTYSYCACFRELLAIFVYILLSLLVVVVVALLFYVHKHLRSCRDGH